MSVISSKIESVEADAVFAGQPENCTTYEEAESYILSIPRFTSKNSLGATRAFYEYLGRPGKNALTFHTAGTNGKGSTCAYIESMARHGGYRTGMFTSPHLVTLRERFRLDGEMIDRESFLRLFQRIGGALEEYRRAESFLAYHPTFFEYLFFMAALWFEEKGAKVVVLETGLGGRLDATNVIERPAVCVITSIGRDHEQYLGGSIREIAGEKAGIIKRGSPVVYSNIRQEASAVIEERAGELGCFCRAVEKTRRDTLCFADKHIDFSLATRYYGNIRCRLNTTAEYQPDNAALAVAAIEEAGLKMTAEQIGEGLGRCRWEARMEEILPGVFLDGAHNEDGIHALLATARRDGAGRRFLLFSAMADKDYRNMKAMLDASGLFDVVYGAPLKNERGLRSHELKELFGEERFRLAGDSVTALQEILSRKRETDKVYIAGSLYLAGEIKAFLERERSASKTGGKCIS